ncbi:hypothetical protein BDB01DRAFT_857324, partial [Pilobolus umbonatus]
MSNNNSQPTPRSERIRNVYNKSISYNCFYCLKAFDRSTKRSAHIRNAKNCREMAKAAAVAAAATAFDRDVDMDISIDD